MKTKLLLLLLLAFNYSNAQVTDGLIQYFNFNGSMTVTDMQLNELNVKPDAKMLNDCVLDLQRYYKPH